MIDYIEALLVEYLPTIVVVVIIVCTYLYMNRPPPPPPPRKIVPKPLASKVKKSSSSSSQNTKTMKILFGTQTRTAEDFSHVIEKEAKKIGISCEVVDLESYDPEDLANEYFVVFVVATHGEGDPTDNAKEFYQWLISEDRMPSSLSTPYIVFGLGNKTYEHYNAVARVMDRRMEELGGKRVYDRGEGDDDATLEEDFVHWKKNMWVEVCKYLGFELKASEDDKFVPRFRMVTVNAEGQDINNTYIRIVPPRAKPKTGTDGKIQYDNKHPFLATVVDNIELHGSLSDRSCRHVEFDIDTSLTYAPGDHLGILPVNDDALVQHLLARLGVDGDTTFAMVPVDKAGAVQEATFGPYTIRKALKEHLDITNPPRKSIIRALAEYTTNTTEKAKLIHLASEEGSEEYNTFIKHEFRSVIEILDHFPGVQPPISHFLELLPRLPSRFYSISSSLNHKPNHVTVTSVVVNFKNGANHIHNGVCSTWLSKLKVGSKVPVYIRESHFRLPSYFGGSHLKKSTNAGMASQANSSSSLPTVPPPMIMVGPGTGLAPFRGFLQEMQHKRHQDQSTAPYETLVYFGCRGKEVDFLYRLEMEQYQKNGVIQDLIVAYSRETQEKVYVQHKLLQDKVRVWDLIQKGAYFYICGDARQMAKSVHQSLTLIIKEFAQLDDNSSQQFIEDMTKQGRFLQDVWF